MIGIWAINHGTRENTFYLRYNFAPGVHCIKDELKNRNFYLSCHINLSINLKHGDHLLKLFLLSLSLFPKNKNLTLYYSSVAYQCWTVYQICCACVCAGKPVLLQPRDDPIHSFNKFTWVVLIYRGNMLAIVAAHLLQDVDDSSYNNTGNERRGENYVTLITWKF